VQTQLIHVLYLTKLPRKRTILIDTKIAGLIRSRRVEEFIDDLIIGVLEYIISGGLVDGALKK